MNDEPPTRRGDEAGSGEHCARRDSSGERTNTVPDGEDHKGSLSVEIGPQSDEPPLPLAGTLRHCDDAQSSRIVPTPAHASQHRGDLEHAPSVAGVGGVLHNTRESTRMRSRACVRITSRRVGARRGRRRPASGGEGAVEGAVDERRTRVDAGAVSSVRRPTSEISGNHCKYVDIWTAVNDKFTSGFVQPTREPEDS